jgi:hypothetical protein
VKLPARPPQSKFAQTHTKGNKGLWCLYACDCARLWSAVC